MLIPRNEKEEIEFYCKFLKVFLVNLPNEKEKSNIYLWIEKLRQDEESTLKIRKDYLKYLLILLQKRQILHPFSRPPKDNLFKHNFEHINRNTLTKKLYEQLSLTNFIINTPKYLEEISEDGKDIAIFQQIPKFGIHGFVSYSKKHKKKDKKNEDVCSKISMENHSELSKSKEVCDTYSFKSMSQMLGYQKLTVEKDSFFDDECNLHEPYFNTSRESHRIRPSTSLLRRESSKDPTTSKECNNQKSNGNHQTYIEQIYYDSQYDCKEHSDSSIFVKISDRKIEPEEEDEKELSEISDISSISPKRITTNRNYYSQNDMDKRAREFLLSESRSKSVRAQCSAKTFIVANKNSLIRSQSKRINEDEKFSDKEKCNPTQKVKDYLKDTNQYYSHLNDNRVSLQFPKTWVRYKTNSTSNASGLAVCTYPSKYEALSQLRNSRIYWNPDNPEMKELLDILDTIRKDMEMKFKSAQDCRRKIEE